MQAIVKNFRGINQAEITISQIALVCGLNGAGKTSIARAIAAAATGKPIPYSKVTKKECDILLRRGSKTGMSALGTQEEGSTQVEWPKAEVQSFGSPPFASEIACGITDIFTMAEKDALAYMIGLLKANPTMDDIKATCELAGFKEATKIAEAIWKIIEEKGWDGAHARAKETGSQLKGSWQHVTGANYGKKKADEWFPADWDDAFLSEDYTTIIATLKQQLEAAIGKSAVDKAERARLQDLVDRMPELKAASARAVAKLDEATEKLKEVEDKLKSTPNPSAKQEYECPHCAGAINITSVSGTDYMLTKAQKVNEEKLKEARLEHAGLCGEQQNLSREKNNATQAVRDAAKAESDAMAAAEALKKMGEETKAGNAPNVDSVRAELAEAEKRQQMVSKYQEARKYAAQIAENQTIIDMLDETGIRKEKLGKCLDAFVATYIAPLCESFKVPAITINSGLGVMMGEVTYPMLSASEQFRVRTVLQLAIAMLEKSDLVIIDGADILDKNSRKYLLEMVRLSGMKAIICMTLNKPDAAPNLALAGLGITYWVEKGSCRPLVITGGERSAA